MTAASERHSAARGELASISRTTPGEEVVSNNIAIALNDDELGMPPTPAGNPTPVRSNAPTSSPQVPAMDRLRRSPAAAQDDAQCALWRREHGDLAFLADRRPAEIGLS